ncbi:MAG: 2-keto-myo-inositol isomerase [Blastocatellia bacterium]|jgi:2-keto-myo-inositol isomerase|nr:2-keto-myo-inositol isomerase [Blastocatellia bacterium]
MKLALNGATTMKADLRTDILAAQAASFDYVEIWAAKLRNYLIHESGSVADLRRLFEASAVEPLSINSIEHITFRSDADYAKIKSECEELSSIAAALECPYVVVVPGKLPANPPTREEVIAESVRVLSELGEIAGSHGVSLAFEFLGQTDCSVQTLELANEIVSRVARANVGLVIDSFHFYAGGSTIEMIEALDPERLFIFHINDAEDLPREQLQDSHRLLPGVGILPLSEILNAFKRIGYDRVASVEIFRPEYWERDPFELARDAKSALKTVLGET